MAPSERFEEGSMLVDAKRALVRALQSDLAREIAVLRQVAQSTRDAATHEEARPENDKDTRAIEAGYLAGAQAERVRDLEGVANALEFLELRAFGAQGGIGLSAVVELDRDGERSLYFVAPQGGGMRSVFAGAPVVVITPKSPIGRALLGKEVGNLVELAVDRGAREYEVVAVH